MTASKPSSSRCCRKISADGRECVASLSRSFAFIKSRCRRSSPAAAATRPAARITCRNRSRATAWSAADGSARSVCAAATHSAATATIPFHFPRSLDHEITKSSDGTPRPLSNHALISRSLSVPAFRDAAAATAPRSVGERDDRSAPAARRAPSRGTRPQAPGTQQPPRHRSAPAPSGNATPAGPAMTVAMRTPARSSSKPPRSEPCFRIAARTIVHWILKEFRNDAGEPLDLVPGAPAPA